MAQMLHEVQRGACSKTDAKYLRENGGYSAPLVLYLDALSVYAAVTATFIKIPAEKSLLSHIQFLRELLDNGVLSALIWIDTRDMVADGMTKGAVGRELLHRLMNGYTTFMHPYKIWQPRIPHNRK